MVLYEIATRSLPFDHVKTPFSTVLIDMVAKGERPIVPEHLYLPAGYLDLMRDCWQNEPTQRPSFMDIVSVVDALELVGARNMSRAGSISDSYG